MHPPWIYFLVFLLLFGVASKVSGNVKKEAEFTENENSTALRSQREVYERERRLIPYMTYYITQNLNPNSGTRQNIYVPITSSRENIFQLDTVTKVPITNVQNVNQHPQHYEILPKPVVRIQAPSILTSTIQTAGQNIPYNTNPGGNIFSQLYKQPELIRPQNPTQNYAQQIQSETQPLQVIKLNQLPLEQKYNQPQIIKIIPIIAKLSSENKSPKSLPSPQSHLAYTDTKIQRLVPEPYQNDQNYYKETVTTLSENKIYSPRIPQEPQLAIFSPTLKSEKNKYTIPPIVLSSTTPRPYTEIEFNVKNPGTKILNKAAPDINPTRINLTPAAYEREIISTVPSYASTKYVSSTLGEQKVYFNQEPEGAVQNQKAEQVPRLRVPQEEKLRFVASVTSLPVSNELENLQHTIKYEEKAKPFAYDQSLDNILTILKDTNKLPQNLTPDNLDTGIKTLALILKRLQDYKNHQQKIPIKNTSTSEPSTVIIQSNHPNIKKVHSFPERSGTSTPGRPGVDYPVYSSIPQTKFDCSTQRYKGFFGDPDTNCQVWHYCDLNGGQASFLCPNGTIFSQVALTCDWWFNVKCESTSQLYVLNERLYKYILPFSPSFPEDYSGPVVDTYLAAKFKEMEAKTKSKALKSVTNSTTTEKPEISTEAITEAVTEMIEYRSVTPEE